MRVYNNIVIVYPLDNSIGFLQPILNELNSLFPNAVTLRPQPGTYGSAISDETELVIFLGHGTPSQLYGSLNDSGEKSVFLNVTNGSLLLDGVDIILFACNSDDYFRKIKRNAEIDCYVTFGDMPTDWEHINHNRDQDANFLKDFEEEHLEYYKTVIVESVVEGFKNGVRTNSIIGIPKRISFVVNQKINEVILERNWSKPQKLQMIELLNDFKTEIRYAQPL
ncbi:MAG: hypothetical protein CMB80_05935 [Flammeovirgaceae bacterium]|nr:hypothetical protein [Flammeovirgaceae bacterium]MBE62704.1 hypothetical protein [Flammeovirgaceae bacterium]MBR10940.1 hypothetical protein [Rickettsiales bacterium]HCX20468.1 hypothetical protein [Cytophagales bacterium]|tara:strand:+ start:5267 stop:5935 length:669 start_codon:yes stop_codon:yes gene_type:complete